jgi:hypothetical protein
MIKEFWRVTYHCNVSRKNYKCEIPCDKAATPQEAADRCRMLNDASTLQINSVEFCVTVENEVDNWS